MAEDAIEAIISDNLGIRRRKVVDKIEKAGVLTQKATKPAKAK
jgi:hypothetical protein